MEYMQAKADDGLRNKEQHDSKGNGWVCNNDNMHNLIIERCREGLRMLSLLHAHPLPLP